MKAQALALLAVGNSIAYAAKTVGTSRSTVIRWRDQAGLSPALRGEGPTEKREQIGRQLLDLTCESIESLRFLARAVRNEAWFQRQDADAIATLLGVLSDKTLRLLTALRPPDDEGAAQALEAPPESDPAGG